MTVELVRDETNWWTATVLEVPGCLTQGRTIDQAMRRIREALELFDVDPDAVALVERVRLPTKALRAIDRSQEARKRAEEEQRRAQSALKETAHLLEELGLSVRDAAKLLGLSHQRIQQLRHSEG
ncbi:MAG TPA: transcriptional regulator [Myxococcales bacterium]|nr:transcriptional regulator [Myxococcales bacterium]